MTAATQSAVGTSAAAYRESDGFGIALYFSPDLASPRSSEVLIIDLANLIPFAVLTGSAADGYDLFAHPAVYSARYADALCERSAS